MYYLDIVPKHLIKTYHTQYDVKEYYVSAIGRVVVVTHLTNGNTYKEDFGINEFLDANVGSEISVLISYYVWPM